MPPRPPKRLRAWVEIAESEGWTYDETSKGHPRLTPPKGLRDASGERLAPPVTFAKTPSNHRGDANTVAALRRLGVPIPGKDGRRPDGR